MTDWDIKTIVVGYDGSAGAERAAELAAALARNNKASIVVVTTFHVSLQADIEGQRVSRAVAEADNTAEEIVRKLRAAGIAAEPDVLEGQAGEGLLRAADAHDADLVVVGRRGRGLTAELLLGSTSEYVVRRAKVPVLVAH